MATYNLALILGNPLNNAEFLLAKQTPPPKFGIEEYDSFVDSGLWDLPSKKLDLVEGELEPGSFVIEGLERTSLRNFDFDSAINKVICKFNFVFLNWGFVLFYRLVNWVSIFLCAFVGFGASGV